MIIEEQQHAPPPPAAHAASCGDARLPACCCRCQRRRGGLLRAWRHQHWSITASGCCSSFFFSLLFFGHRTTQRCSCCSTTLLLSSTRSALSRREKPHDDAPATAPLAALMNASTLAGSCEQRSTAARQRPPNITRTACLRKVQSSHGVEGGPAPSSPRPGRSPPWTRPPRRGGPPSSRRRRSPGRARLRMLPLGDVSPGSSASGVCGAHPRIGQNARCPHPRGSTPSWRRPWGSSASSSRTFGRCRKINRSLRHVRRSCL